MDEYEYEFFQQEMMWHIQEQMADIHKEDDRDGKRDKGGNQTDNK